MKRILLIMAMGLMLLPSFGKKVIVLEVTKEGDGWQNMFNMYREVTTTYVGNQNGVPCVDLTCRGAGYTWCRASRQIGEMDFGATPGDSREVLSNQQIVNAVNELLEASETAFARNSRVTAASRKVAIQNNDKTLLCCVKATWNYNNRTATPQAKIVITIEVDDSGLLNRKI